MAAKMRSRGVPAGARHKSVTMKFGTDDVSRKGREGRNEKVFLSPVRDSLFGDWFVQGKLRFFCFLCELCGLCVRMN